MPGPMLNISEDNAELLLQAQCAPRPAHGMGSSPSLPPCYGARLPLPHPSHHHYPTTQPPPPYPPQQAPGCYASHVPPPPHPAYHYINEQRRRQKLKREIVLAAFDGLPIASLPSSRGEAARAASPTALQRFMATRTLPPHPFWENVALLQSNPSILHFIRDFGRCDWMEVDCATMTVRMSSASLEQLRLTDELLVQWLRYYDPTLPFWTLFATLATYSGFMVGKLVGHLRNIEANTGAKVWVAPRDPDATFVSFFICGKTEESTMMAFHALQARELAALSLGEKLGSTSSGSTASTASSVTSNSNSTGEEESPCSAGIEGRTISDLTQPDDEQQERPEGEEEEEDAAASPSVPELREAEASGEEASVNEAAAGAEEGVEERMSGLSLGSRSPPRPKQQHAKKNEASPARGAATKNQPHPKRQGTQAQQQQPQGGAARQSMGEAEAPEVALVGGDEDDVRAA